jgi:hypothetical protein
MDGRSHEVGVSALVKQLPKDRLHYGLGFEGASATNALRLRDNMDCGQIKARFSTVQMC